MSLRNKKRALVARLLTGPIAIERSAIINEYRVSVPTDPDPRRSVLMRLLPELDHIVEAYDADHACANIDGKHVRLTTAEADAIAALLHRTFQVRPRSSSEIGATAVYCGSECTRKSAGPLMLRRRAPLRTDLRSTSASRPSATQ